jgi:hypothetical protein
MGGPPSRTINDNFETGESIDNSKPPTQIN